MMGIPLTSMISDTYLHIIPRWLSITPAFNRLPIWLQLRPTICDSISHEIPICPFVSSCNTPLEMSFWPVVILNPQSNHSLLLLLIHLSLLKFKRLPNKNNQIEIHPLNVSLYWFGKERWDADRWLRYEWMCESFKVFSSMEGEAFI